MTELAPCPFCNGEPRFDGDGDNWRDESRYVTMSLVCCITMEKSIGWQRARGMTPQARESELRQKLIEAWNHRPQPTLEQPNE